MERDRDGEEDGDAKGDGDGEMEIAERAYRDREISECTEE
jgi:hypothetical protein